MSWGKLSDDFIDHPKVLKLGPDLAIGVCLWVGGLNYATRYLTDGFIPAMRLERLTALQPRIAKRAAARLVEAGLWDLVPDGYAIHDFLEYNPSRVKAEAERLVNRERQRRHQERQRSNGVNNVAPNGGSNGVANDAPSRPVPVPEEILSRVSSHTNGTEAALGVAPADPRYPFAALLARRFRFHAVSDSQWERLYEVVDNEYPRGTRKGRDPRAGWVWLAAQLDSLPRDAGDPIRAFFAKYNPELDRRREATS